MIRTTLPESQLHANAVVRVYKQLKHAEQAFRSMKDTLELRPIHHHLETRVRAHVFLCMLAYYVTYELQQRLAPLLYTDTTPITPADPVAPAQRSAAANAKPASHHTPDGYPAHSLPDLLTELATLTRNDIRVASSDHTFPRLTTPTPIQARAYQLLNLTPHP